MDSDLVTPSAAQSGPNLSTGFLVGGIYSIDNSNSDGISTKDFVGTNTTCDEKVAIRVASCKTERQLKNNARVYKALAGSPGIPFVHWFGSVDGYDAMVLDPSGPNLEDHLNSCNGKFSLKTVLLLADQFISRIQSIHERLFIHRDIKPNTFHMGFGMRGNQVNIFDFCFAKRYRDPKTKDHIAFRENKRLIGAVRYASISSHLGIEQSRRDDMESLGYVMLYYLRGSLPWQGLKATSRQEKYDLILEKKKGTSIEVLCRGLPKEFVTYVNYTRSLGFDDEPNYDYLRDLFRSLFVREGFQKDYVFDWIWYNQKKKFPAQNDFQTIGQAAQHSTSVAISDTIIHELEPQPISQEQLVAEFKGIYESLKKAEAKCIVADNCLAALNLAEQEWTTEWTAHAWRPLFVKHRFLLQEFHNLFLVSQHPSASPALRRIVSDYSVPERVWRHGVHSFLDLLRRYLPASLEFMLSFIYLAYPVMTLLFEECPAFEDVWIERLGDISRYRMAIEETDRTDRETWAGVTRDCYSKASNKSPTTGRFYHHLAILTPNALQQLFYYLKSLCVEAPYPKTQESIFAILDKDKHGLPPLDTAFLKAHRILFTGKEKENFGLVVKEVLGQFDAQIERVTSDIAIINIIAILGFGSKRSLLMKVISSKNKNGGFEEQSLWTESFENAQLLNNSTLEILLRKDNDPNVLSFIYITLVFMYEMCRHRRVMIHLESKFPWDLLSEKLNKLLAEYGESAGINGDIPLLEKGNDYPLPEDVAMRGFDWTENYFPEEWFTTKKADSFGKSLAERILFLGCHIANSGYGLSYDSSGRKFSSLVSIDIILDFIKIELNERDGWEDYHEDDGWMDWVGSQRQLGDGEFADG